MCNFEPIRNFFCLFASFFVFRTRLKYIVIEEREKMMVDNCRFWEGHAFDILYLNKLNFVGYQAST